MLALLLCLQTIAEARYYATDHLTPPAGETLEVGGMDFLPDGRLVVSTRRGQVWTVANALADDPAEAEFTLFAEGLWEGLGLNVVDDRLFVVQRGEISELIDGDGDGRCDRIDTYCDDWGLSGNYHEFVYGLPRDDAGNFFVSLNVSFFSPEWWHGKSTVPWRGWVLKVDPEGNATPFASGLRSPAGMGMDTKGRLFVTDNQGDWMPASPIFHVEEGGFYGHPASLAWTEEYRATATEPSDTVPPARAASDRGDAAIWLPYAWSRSPGNLVPDTTGGRFGPFRGQMFLAELTNGRLFRCQFEEVQGQVQGAVIPFLEGIGSAYRVRFAQDGTLFVGMTNRGWGGRAPASGVARVRWTRRRPLEITTVSLVEGGGFRLGFTRELDEAPGPDDLHLVQYDYDYWWEYGSPERETVEVPVTAVELAADRRSLVARAPELRAAKVARMRLAGIVDEEGTPLLHPEFAYTVNQLLDGPRTTEHVAKIVPPPPARQSDEEGWLRLTWGDATDGWNHSGWELCDVELDPDDATRLVTKKGVNALSNTLSDAPTDYTSKLQLGSGRYQTRFLLPEGGETALWLQGRYRIVLRDAGDEEPSTRTTGAIDGGDVWAGFAPKEDAFHGPGEWNELDLKFEAPKFDATGAKTANARIAWLSVNDVTLMTEVELEGPSADLDEVELGPLVLEGTRTHCAFGGLLYRPGTPAWAREGWRALFDGDADEPLADWTTTGDATWTVDDGVLVGEGRAGFLVSPRGDYGDHEVRARMKISDGGNSGLLVRAGVDGERPRGYEAEVNSSFADPQKTGSLRDLAPIRTHLVPEDTWFDYHVRVTDEEDGVRVQVRVNGVLVNDHLDTERRFGRGHVALQQHHEGSVVEVSDLQVREL